MLRTSILLWAAWCAGTLCASPAAAVERPNVIVLLSDDQRFDTIHALGNPQIRTPNLDRLVQSGFVFSRTYCMGSMQGAVCVPSRAMIQSGRSLFHVSERLADIPLWPAIMQQSGYTTFATGKWHNGPPSFARAFEDGRSVFFGGMSNQFQVPVKNLLPGGQFTKEIKGQTFSSQLFVDEALQFLKADHGKQPFFLYVAFTAPHDPRTPPGEYKTMYDPAKLTLPPNFLPQHPFNNGEMTVRDEKLANWPRTPDEIRQHLADYYGIISHLDEQVGRILQALAERGLLENTIILFTSDHGLAVGQHGLLGKQNLYEHSMRPPLVFSGPGIPAGRSDALVYLYDLFPTVCDLTQTPIPQTVEGKSLVSIMTGKAETVRDGVLLAYRDCQRAFVEPRWKVIRYPQISRTQLFDLSRDPWEMHDLSADPQHATELNRMMTRLAEAQRFNGDTLPLTAAQQIPAEIDLSKTPASQK